MPSLGSTAADKELAAYISDFRELDTTEATAFFYKAQMLAAIYNALVARLGEEEGTAEYHRIRKEELALGDVTVDGRTVKRGGLASKLLKVGRYLADAPEAIHSLPGSFQYYAAVAIERGIPADTVYTDAATLPMRDFIEHHGLVKPRSSTKRRYSDEEVDALAEAAFNEAESCRMSENVNRCGESCNCPLYRALLPFRKEQPNG